MNLDMEVDDDIGVSEQQQDGIICCGSCFQLLKILSNPPITCGCEQWMRVEILNRREHEVSPRF